jgi:hypothetical protein
MTNACRGLISKTGGKRPAEEVGQQDPGRAYLPRDKSPPQKEENFLSGLASVSFSRISFCVANLSEYTGSPRGKAEYSVMSQYPSF